jgi:acetyl esterase/lipase
MVNSSNTDHAATATTYDTTWLEVGNHFAADYRPAPGLTFTIPVGLTGVAAGDITDVYVEFTVQTAHTGAFPGLASSEPPCKLTNSTPTGGAFPASRNTGNSPVSIYNASGLSAIRWTAANGAWTKASGTTSVGTAVRSPNLAAHLADAITAGAVPGTDKVTFCSLGETGANNLLRVYSYSGTTKPVLKVVANVTAVSTGVTATTPSASSSVPTPTISYRYNDISYHDGVGDSTRRVIDVHTPSTTPPASGWPVLMFVHGGAFNSGDEDDVATFTRFLSDALGRGFAVVSVSYKFARGNLIFNLSDQWTRPHMTQDILAAMKWVTTQSTYDLNPDFIVGCGNSAGAHIMLEAALLAEDATPDGYTNVYRGQAPGGTPGITGPLGTRYTAWPTLSNTEGRTGIPTVKGMFSFGGPVKLTQVWTDNALFRGAIAVYYGGAPDATISAAGVGSEGDLDAFVTSASGSIYDARTAAAPSFPIGISYSTADTTVTPAASYTPLRSALDTVGYDVSQDSNGTVATGVALSRHGYTGTGDGGGHVNLMTQYDSAFFTGWLDEVIAQNAGIDDSASPGAAELVMSVPSVTISIDDSASPGAAELVMSVPSVTISIDDSASPGAAELVMSVPSVTISTAAAVDGSAAEITVSVPSVTIDVVSGLTVSVVTAGGSVSPVTLWHSDGAGGLVAVESGHQS